MKTIRTNCFETNSSSTHSITIISTKDNANKQPLVTEDNELLPENLIHSNAYHKSEATGGSTLHARTVPEKAALMLHHFNEIEYANGHGVTKADRGKCIEAIVNELTVETGTFAKINTEFVSNFDSYDESETYVDAIFGSFDVIDAIKKFINDVVLNDAKSIVDEHESY